MRVLYFADVEPGGLADYAIYQATALQNAGACVTLLGLAHLREKVAAMCSDIHFMPLHDIPRSKNSWANAIRTVLIKRRRVAELCDIVEDRNIKNVLLAAYSEYFSPLWANRLRKKHGSGTWFGVVLHDPFRDFQLGPHVWHRHSVKQAFSFIDRVYTHGACEIDTGLMYPPPVTCIPHGPYHYPIPAQAVSKSELKQQFGLPDSAHVLLSFGHIRDSKNLALLIESLAFLPEYHLLIAGREQSRGQKPVTWYQDLAKRLGVHHRCHWHNEFIADDDVWRYFTVADLLMLLYKPTFRSASGVLSANVQFALPVIASGGEGPLKQNVQDYKLGVWLENPSIDSVRKAVHDMRVQEVQPEAWARFERENSWERNANLILESIGKQT